MNELLHNTFSNLTAALLFMVWLTSMFFCIESLRKRKSYDFLIQLLVLTVTIFLLWILSALAVGVCAIMR